MYKLNISILDEGALSSNRLLYVTSTKDMLGTSQNVKQKKKKKEKYPDKKRPR